MLKFLTYTVCSLLRSKRVTEFLDDSHMKNLGQQIACTLNALILPNSDDRLRAITELHRGANRELASIPVQNVSEVWDLKTVIKNFFDLAKDLAYTENHSMVPFEYILQRLVQGREMTSHAEFARDEELSVKKILEDIEKDEIPVESSFKLKGPGNSTLVA